LSINCLQRELDADKRHHIIAALNDDDFGQSRVVSSCLTELCTEQFNIMIICDTMPLCTLTELTVTVSQYDCDKRMTMSAEMSTSNVIPNSIVHCQVGHRVHR